MKSKKTSTGISKVIILISAFAIYFVVIWFLNQGGKIDSNISDLTDSDTVTAIVNDSELKLEVARSFEKKQTGLMNINEPLEENTGMMFVYDELQYLDFWMKDTFIPLDIIFLDEDMEVVVIHENTKINQTETIYKSVKRAQVVVELNAGESEELGIVPGSVFKISDQ